MRFMRNKRPFIFLIGFIILVVLIGYSLRDRVNVTFAEEMINDAVGWIQYVIHVPVNFTTEVITNIDDFKNTYEENQILKEQISQYKGLVYDVQEINKENEQLRSALELIESDSIRSHEVIQAVVMSRTPERWLELITINKGKEHGVEANMLVMTAEGMIGKVQTPSKVTSTVKLLTGFDQFNRISAMVSRDEEKNVFGMIEGYDDETESLMLRIIEDSVQEIKEGELVVSSGMGGVFPAGVTIGKVREVVSDQYGLTQIALIEPAADMYEINHVIVLDRKIGQADGTEEAAEEEEE